jgi:hypothetical protein
VAAWMHDLQLFFFERQKILFIKEKNIRDILPTTVGEVQKLILLLI